MATPDAEAPSAPAPSWSEYYSVTNSTEKSVGEALEVLESTCDRLNLNGHVRTSAAHVYAEASIENLTDGRPTDLVIGAAVAIGSRDEHTPRPLRRIAEAAGVEINSLRRLIRRLSRELDRSTSLCPPQEYLPFLCKDLHLEEETEVAAQRLLKSIGDSAFSGKNPVGIAGAMLYLAADGAVTQRAVANAAGVTGETIRVRLSDCREAGVAP